MVKKKEIAAVDTPIRRSKRLMKLKADDNAPEEFNQQPDDASSSTLLPPAQSPETTYKSDSATASNADNLEDLAIDVFKNMKRVLVNLSEDGCKSSASVGQQSEVLMLESVKTPCRKIQL